MSTLLVWVLTQPGCTYCDALKRTLLPIMDGILAAGAVPGATMRVTGGAALPPALRAHVKGYPTVLFVLDGQAVPRHTISGFPSDFDSPEQFAEWFGRYVAAARTGDV